MRTRDSDLLVRLLAHRPASAVLGLAAIAVLMLFTQRAASAEDAAPLGDQASDRANQAQAAKVVQLVGQLGAPDFRTREAAMQQLIAIGGPAIDAVAKAAQTDDLEMSYRAVRILQSLLDTNERAVQIRAERALEMLAARETTASADLAGDALAFYDLTRQERAVDELRRLGAEIASSGSLSPSGIYIAGMPAITGMPPGYYQILIGSKWKGGSDDLGLLKQVPNLYWLGIHGVPLNDSALKTIVELGQATRIELYGTGILPESESAAKLERALAGVRVDVRRGAFLGIAPSQSSFQCVIGRVTEQSAAEAAGLLIGDEIFSFDGQPVGTFEQLTSYIATKAGGETVTLEIRRSEQTLTKQVVLGKWSEVGNRQ